MDTNCELTAVTKHDNNVLAEAEPVGLQSFRWSISHQRNPMVRYT
jgi:hypothetical protein